MFQLTCPGKQCVRNDVLSGLTVALALVPEAVAFAFVAGVEPLVGLYGAFLMGLITAVIGGRPGMISGATGAMAVVMVALVSSHGVQYLFAAVVLTGVIQVLAGVFHLGKFIRLVPYPVMLGFVNGLAIVIFLAQLQQFQAPGADGELTWLAGSQLWIINNQDPHIFIHGTIKTDEETGSFSYTLALIESNTPKADEHYHRIRC